MTTAVAVELPHIDDLFSVERTMGVVGNITAIGPQLWAFLS